MLPTVTAVFQDGVLRPTSPPNITDGATVRLIVLPEAPEPPPSVASVRDILARRYKSGHTDTAERHNEHQP